MTNNLMSKIGIGVLVASAALNSGCMAPGRYGLDNANTRRLGTAISRQFMEEERASVMGRDKYLSNDAYSLGE